MKSKLTLLTFLTCPGLIVIDSSVHVVQRENVCLHNLSSSGSASETILLSAQFSVK